MPTTSRDTRRTFVTRTLASIAALATASRAERQAPEVPTYAAEIPPGATLWALFAFTADEPIEITLKAGESLKTLRGRFDGQRLAEYSWRNDSNAAERVLVRAKALAGDWLSEELTPRSCRCADRRPE